MVMLYGTETIKEALVDQAEAFSGWATITLLKSIFRDYGRNLKGWDVVSWRMGTERERRI